MQLLVFIWSGYHPEGFLFYFSDKLWILFPLRAKPALKLIYSPRFQSLLPCYPVKYVFIFLVQTILQRTEM